MAVLKAFSESGRYRGGASNSSSSVSVKSVIVKKMGERKRQKV